MICFILLVDKVLDLPDVPYDMHDNLRCYACAVAAEYKEHAFHGGVRLW